MCWENLNRQFFQHLHYCFCLQNLTQNVNIWYAVCRIQSSFIKIKTKYKKPPTRCIYFLRIPSLKIKKHKTTNIICLVLLYINSSYKILPELSNSSFEPYNKNLQNSALVVLHIWFIWAIPKMYTKCKKATAIKNV